MARWGRITTVLIAVAGLLFAFGPGVALADGLVTYQEGVAGADGSVREYTYEYADTNALTCGGGYGGCTIMVDGVSVATCNHFNACSYTNTTTTGLHPVHTVRFILLGGEPFSIKGQNTQVQGVYSMHWASAIKLLPDSMNGAWFTGAVNGWADSPILKSMFIYGIALFLTFLGITTFRKIAQEFFGGELHMVDKMSKGNNAPNSKEPSAYMDDTGGGRRAKGSYKVD